MALPINLPVIERRVLDSSIMRTLSRCPRMAMYKYVFNRRSHDEDSTSTDFGSAYHKYRETIEKARQENPTANPIAIDLVARKVATQGFDDPDENVKHNYLDKSRLNKSFDSAFTKWQNESGIYHVLHTEVSFELPLPSGRLYGGRFDQILEWNKRLWVRDFKTTSWLANNLGEKYALDHQMSGYCWAAQILTNRPVDGVLVEILHNTKAEVAKIKPLMTTRTQGDIDMFVEWAEDKWDEWERRMKSGVWVMHDNSCFDFNKKCVFHDACAKGDYEAIEEWLKENSDIEVWDHANPKD